VITKDYFRTMGVQVLKGRSFDERDIVAKPWRIVVSQRLAEQLWPDQDPVGRQALLWRGQGNRPAEVIGVVGNMRERGISQPPTLAVYFPAYGASLDNMHFVIHTSASVETLTPMLRSLLSNIDPALPLSNVETLEEVVSRSTASRRLTLLLLSAFAATALALALVGIFGVTSYSVSRQTAEIGIRVALGASHDRVLRAIVLQAMKPVVTGIALGLVSALLLSRVIENLLFSTSSRDPMIYAAVAALMTVTAVVACLVPARQALRVDVVAALRAE
jgi:putative ABC transport system permease protein